MVPGRASRRWVASLLAVIGAAAAANALPPIVQYQPLHIIHKNLSGMLGLWLLELRRACGRPGT